MPLASSIKGCRGHAVRKQQPQRRRDVPIRGASANAPRVGSVLRNAVAHIVAA
jgi:hypothetical protein